MEKFINWIRNNDKKKFCIAEKVGISNSSLHDILKNGHTPSLKTAYKIEQYTRGAITLYDWLDQSDRVTKESKKILDKNDR